jgi:hypothetical protein
MCQLLPLEPHRSQVSRSINVIYRTKTSKLQVLTSWKKHYNQEFGEYLDESEFNLSVYIKFLIEILNLRISYSSKTRTSIRLRLSISVPLSVSIPTKLSMRSLGHPTTSPLRYLIRSTMKNVTSGPVVLFFTSFCQECPLSTAAVTKTS